jgi:hypothetical protein
MLPARCRYDPLAMLAAHPTTLERFFEVELKTVQACRER